jgi:hypothetical protein
MAGEVKPYLVGAMPPNFCLCRSILIFIANPRVFHLALHTGSDTGKEYGLHTFPRSILRLLEANALAKWLELFPFPLSGGATNTNTGVIPKNFSIRFNAHRDSIYNTSLVNRSGPPTPSASALNRQAHAGALTAHHPCPPILRETFVACQTALDSLPEEPAPVTLPALKGRFFQSDDIDAEAVEDPPVHAAADPVLPPRPTTTHSNTAPLRLGEDPHLLTEEEGRHATLATFMHAPLLRGATHIYLGDISSPLPFPYGHPGPTHRHFAHHPAHPH